MQNLNGGHRSSRAQSSVSINLSRAKAKFFSCTLLSRRRASRGMGAAAKALAPSAVAGTPLARKAAVAVAAAEAWTPSAVAGTPLARKAAGAVAAAEARTPSAVAGTPSDTARRKETACGSSSV